MWLCWMIYPAKKPRVYVRSGSQPCQDSAVRFFGQVWNRTEPNHRSKTKPLAGYPDLLLTLSLCQNIRHWLTDSWQCCSLCRYMVVIWVHLTSALQWVGHWEMAQVFMAKLQLSLLGMSSPMIEPCNVSFYQQVFPHWAGSMFWWMAKNLMTNNTYDARAAGLFYSVV